MPLVFPHFPENGLEVHVVGSVKLTCQAGVAWELNWFEFIMWIASHSPVPAACALKYGAESAKSWMVWRCQESCLCLWLVTADWRVWHMSPIYRHAHIHPRLCSSIQTHRHPHPWACAHFSLNAFLQPNDFLTICYPSQTDCFSWFSGPSTGIHFNQ